MNSIIEKGSVEMGEGHKTAIFLTSLIVVIVGVVFWSASRPSEYERERADRMVAAAKLQEPWAKFQVLMQGYSPNALGNWPSDSDFQKEYSALAIDTLEKALIAKSQPAQDYACRENINFSVLDSLTDKYCPSIGLRNAMDLLALAQEDAKNQGLPIPTESTIAELARKHGGKYTPVGWIFETIKDREEFKRELLPARQTR